MVKSTYSKQFLPLFFVLFGLPVLLFSQTDTLKQQLKEVEVSASPANPEIGTATPVQTLHLQQLQSLPAIQVSDALKFFSGVVIRDYGGIGGLKTISVRGFGTQHTAVAYEGITLSNSQTGQIDLGRISLENVETLSLIQAQKEDLLAPARQFAAANLIDIQNTIPHFKNNQRTSVNFNFTGGSYYLFNPYLKISNLLKSKKHPHDSEVISFIRANYIQSRGNYPFIMNYGNVGDSSSTERRKNSDIQALSAEMGLYTSFKDSSLLTLLFSYYDAERGLPGATILYNLNSKERLWDKAIYGQVKFQKVFSSKLAYRSSAKFDYGYTRYLDPDYLNEQHYLNNIYIQREYYLSNALRYQYRKFKVALSNDLAYQNMSANLPDFANPGRLSILIVLAGQYDHKHFNITGHLLHSLYLQHSNAQTGKNVNRLSPALSFSLRPILSEQFYLRLFYKHIFRMPTFNDLYYREVGNSALNPERTNQYNFGITYARYFSSSHFSLNITSDVYYNQVRDKIVAIPNKNLFIWAMLNYGKVNIWGVDANANLFWQPYSWLQLQFLGNYTFQSAQDITSPNSKTYKHQIPYTPKHSGAFHLSLTMYRFTLSGELIMAGERYALQQNTDENRLPPYFDGSIGLGYSFNSNNIPISLKIEVLNIADLHYEIIKNYPMQGRSLRIKLKISL